MAALAGNSYDLEFIGGPGADSVIELKSAVADTFYRNALAWWSTTAEGITPVLAAGTEFAGVVLKASDGAVTAGDRIQVALRGFVRISNLGTAIANAQDAQGQLIFGDVSGGSDNPADVLTDGAAAIGDLAIGRCVEWIDTTTIIVDLSDRSTATVHA